MAIDIPTYQEPEELEKKLAGYFEHCKANDEIPNVVGMAVFCGFASRSSFRDYSKKDERFAHVIKKAKSKLYSEKFQLASSGKMDKTIFIFDAVNNHDMFNTRSDNRNQQSGPKGGPIENKWIIETVSAENSNTKKT